MNMNMNMNEKPDIRQDLSAYLDGELDASRREQLAQALADDEHLARELSQLEATRRLVRQLPRRRPGGDFVAQVLAAAERRELMVSTEHTQESPLGWGRYLAVAAVLLISVGLGVLATVVMQNPGSPGQRVAREPEQNPARPIANGGVRPIGGDLVPARPGRGRLVNSPILLVEIRTSNVSDTSRDVISKVLQANGLSARLQGPTAGAMVWEVEVPRDEVHKVKKDLSSLPSRQIVMKDADYQEVREILASVDVTVGPEVGRTRPSETAESAESARTSDDPQRRIDEILGPEDPSVSAGSEDPQASEVGSDTDLPEVRGVRPMIIKIITDDEGADPEGE
jgi:hypothetical protein